MSWINTPITLPGVSASSGPGWFVPTDQPWPGGMSRACRLWACASARVSRLTNIVKDIARDLHRGRCYVPEPLLHEAGLTPSDLLNRSNLPRFRPVLNRLIKLAMEHLDQGWMYTMALPRSEIRQRLACMWPILLAGETLKRVARSPDLLDPAVNVKAPRSVVYRVLALTTLTGGCGYVGTAYWGRLRKQIL